MDKESVKVLHETIARSLRLVELNRNSPWAVGYKACLEDFAELFPLED